MMCLSGSDTRLDYTSCTYNALIWDHDDDGGCTCTIGPCGFFCCDSGGVVQILKKKSRQLETRFGRVTFWANW